MTTPPRPPTVDLQALPGQQIRRLQQIAVGLFMEELEAFELTPVQFAALAAIAQQPGLDQRTLARTIGLDTSTTGGVIDRLERRALMQRNAAPDDRRVRRLTVTTAGTRMLEKVMPHVLQAQRRILAPLSASEQARFLELLGRLIEANNSASRAPSEPG